MDLIAWQAPQRMRKKACSPFPRSALLAPHTWQGAEGLQSAWQASKHLLRAHTRVVQREGSKDLHLLPRRARVLYLQRRRRGRVRLLHVARAGGRRHAQARQVDRVRLQPGWLLHRVVVALRAPRSFVSTAGFAAPVDRLGRMPASATMQHT